MARTEPYSNQGKQVFAATLGAGFDLVTNFLVLRSNRLISSEYAVPRQERRRAGGDPSEASPISRFAGPRKELLECKKLRAFAVLMLKTGHLETGQQFA